MTDSVDREESRSSAAPGLRERKRLALRRRIQGEAFRLFAERGYDATTVEQIVAAAETSASTFYRYFPAKEDVVAWDELVERIESVLLARPTGEPLPDTLRAIARVVPDAIEADREFQLQRMQLLGSVPPLAQAHYARGVWAMVHVINRVVVARSDLDHGDFRVELIAATVTAVVFAATRRWADENGSTSLEALMDQALRSIAPSVERNLRAPER